MKRFAPWAWLVVLGTALALSWWSLDALALRFGVPEVLAAMVSATFDGAALVAADLALRRAELADPAFAVKLLMLVAVGLSAWLNYEHGLLLGYPLVGRVLFAAPSVLAGWLFELQLRTLRRERLRQTGRSARPLPHFGMVVWLFHPWASLRRVSQIAGSRLQSIPVTVMDWEGAPTLVHELAAVPGEVVDEPVVLAAPVAPLREQEPPARTSESPQVRESERPRTGRSPVPDELYVVKLRDLVEENRGVLPSIREVARKLSIGQDRARRLITRLAREQDDAKS